MAYSLIYSRNIRSDRPVRYLDIPLDSESLMIDALSLNPGLHRQAGWVCPIVSDGVSDYERYPSSVLLFGKNRISLVGVPQPYFLEFFPKYGRRSGILSVYSGFPSPRADRRRWVFDFRGQVQYALNVDSPGISARPGPSGNPSVLLDVPIAEAQLYYDYINYKRADGLMFLVNVFDLSQSFALAVADYEDRKALSDSIDL